MKHKLLLGLGLLALAFTGCIKDISGELPDSEPKITVNSFFNPRVPVLISISQSAGVLNGVQTLVGAQGLLYQNGTLVDSLNYDSFYDYYWASQFTKPLPGNTYRLEVRADGFPSVWAESYQPDSVPLLSISKDTLFYSATGHNTYWLRIRFTDPPTPGDQYHLMVYRNRLSESGYWNLENLCFESDEPAFEVISRELCSGGMFTDNGFNGQEKEILINTRRRINSQLNDSLQFVVELRHGSDPYYRYNKSLAIFKNNQGDIFAQPGPVQGNVTGGYGIFAGYAACTDTVKLN